MAAAELQTPVQRTDSGRGANICQWRLRLDRSSPSAAAASRWSRATRCSTTTCSGSPGRERPRVCFLPSASGDADHYVVRFYRAFPAERCEPTPHLAVPPRAGPGDLRAHLLSQDLIYVGGGSVVSLLGVWRAHGIDEILREAWEAASSSAASRAGSLCWFAEALTRLPRRAASGSRASGLLPFSNSVHYESGPEHGRAYHGLLARRHAVRLRGRGRRRAALRRHAS